MRNITCASFWATAHTQETCDYGWRWVSVWRWSPPGYYTPIIITSYLSRAITVSKTPHYQELPVTTNWSWHTALISRAPTCSHEQNLIELAQHTLTKSYQSWIVVVGTAHPYQKQSVTNSRGWHNTPIPRAISHEQSRMVQHIHTKSYQSRIVVVRTTDISRAASWSYAQLELIQLILMKSCRSRAIRIDTTHI